MAQREKYAPPATASGVIRIVGPLEDDGITSIVSTGATEAEGVEASSSPACSIPSARISPKPRKRRPRTCSRSRTTRNRLPSAQARSLIPALLGGDPRAIDERLELGPDHVGIDCSLTDPGTVAA